MKDEDPVWREAFNKTRENANSKTTEMLLSPHDDLGLVLKCHLIVEDSLTNYLIVAKRLRNIQKARLTFIQKVGLLDDTDCLFSYVGMLREINGIRNRFSHNFEADLEINPDGEIARLTNAYVEGAFKGQDDVLNIIEQLDKEPEQIAALKEMISNLLFKEFTELPDDPRFTGRSIAMLYQKEPREMIASSVRLFCESAAIGIYIHQNVLQLKE